MGNYMGSAESGSGAADRLGVGDNDEQLTVIYHHWKPENT
jgi:hypothetical protein